MGPEWQQCVACMGWMEWLCYAHNILHAVNEPCLIMLWQILTKFSIDCPGQRSAPASGIIYYRPYSCEKKEEKNERRGPI